MPTLDVLPVHVISRQAVISDERCCYSEVLAIVLMQIVDSEEAAEVAPAERAMSSLAQMSRLPHR
jgi:hypothetical protein